MACTRVEFASAFQLPVVVCSRSRIECVFVIYMKDIKSCTRARLSTTHKCGTHARVCMGRCISNCTIESAESQEPSTGRSRRRLWLRKVWHANLQDRMRQNAEMKCTWGGGTQTQSSNIETYLSCAIVAGISMRAVVVVDCTPIRGHTKLVPYR